MLENILNLIGNPITNLFGKFYVMIGEALSIFGNVGALIMALIIVISIVGIWRIVVG